MTMYNPPAPILTDTHTHLGDACFDRDRAAVLARAAAAGIAAIVAVGEDLADAERNVALAREYPILKPAAGLYPTHLDMDAAEALCFFIREHRAKLVAVGEVGLDFWMVKNSETLRLRSMARVKIEIITHQERMRKPTSAKSVAGRVFCRKQKTAVAATRIPNSPSSDQRKVKKSERGLAVGRLPTAGDPRLTAGPLGWIPHGGAKVVSGVFSLGRAGAPGGEKLQARPDGNRRG